MTQNPRPSGGDPHELETKPFLAHLEDLRWTIIRCICALVVGIGACAFGAHYILEALYLPYRQIGHDPKDLFNLGVVDPFSIHIEISLFGGVVVALPALLYFLGQFLLPALTPHEKKFLAPVFFGGALLFVIGVTFCYILVLHAALKFFAEYSSWLGFTTMWTAKGLIDFEVQMLAGFGVAFELPLVVLVLNLLGIVSASQMASKRRHAAVFIFIASCCIIPSTDIFSLSVLSVPMYLLYELCILIAKMVERKKVTGTPKLP
jgi:sec-independent protein translocase protein TatC